MYQYLVLRTRSKERRYTNDLLELFPSLQMVFFICLGKNVFVSFREMEGWISQNFEIVRHLGELVEIPVFTLKLLRAALRPLVRDWWLFYLNKKSKLKRKEIC